MGNFITTNDFDLAQYELALDPEQEQDLDKYIEDAEAEYLPKLFGKALYDLFIADWDSPPAGTPTADRFKQVYDPFIEQNDSVMVTSNGIDEMLIGIVYYLFMRDQITRSTTLGANSFIGENVEAKTAIQHDMTRRYNNAIDTFKSIQYYMNTFNPDDYPEYNGVNCSFANIV